MEGIPIVVPVRFAVAGWAMQTTSGWLSLDSVFVRCPKAPPKGASIALRIGLPGRLAPEEAEGIVGQHVPPGARAAAGFWSGFRDLPAASRHRTGVFLAGRGAAVSARSR